MSFWPNSLTSWMQVLGPVATTGGLAVAWGANWRQGRSRREDIERAQLEAARLVATIPIADLHERRLEGAVVRNNGPVPILDVRVWFETLADKKPIVIAANDPNDGKRVPYVTRRFIGAQEEYRWERLSTRLPQAGVLLLDQAAFFVAWTSSDGIHWRLRNSTELHREPQAKYIGPESVEPAGFRPDVSQQPAQ